MLSSLIKIAVKCVILTPNLQNISTIPKSSGVTLPETIRTQAATGQLPFLPLHFTLLIPKVLVAQ